MMQSCSVAERFDAKSAFESRFGCSPISERTNVDLVRDVKVAQTIYVNQAPLGEELKGEIQQSGLDPQGGRLEEA